MKRLLFFAAVMMLLCSQGQAHGLDFDVRIQPPAVLVQVSYPGQVPLSTGRIEITGPDKEDPVYQKGEIDSHGRLAFLPDRPGIWTLAVDDGAGHRAEKRIEIMKDFMTWDESSELLSNNPVRGRSSGNSLSPGMKILVGLSLIFGLTGILFGFKTAGIHKNKDA